MKKLFHIENLDLKGVLEFVNKHQLQSSDVIITNMLDTYLFIVLYWAETEFPQS